MQDVCKAMSKREKQSVIKVFSNIPKIVQRAKFERQLCHKLEKFELKILTFSC